MARRLQTPQEEPRQRAVWVGGEPSWRIRSSALVLLVLAVIPLREQPARGAIDRGAIGRGAIDRDATDRGAIDRGAIDVASGLHLPELPGML